MEELKRIIERYSVTELVDFISSHFELYHFQKLFLALTIQKAIQNMPKTFEEELIEKEIKEWRKSGHRVKFIVNKRNGIVKAKIEKNKKTVAYGVAHCHPSDKFNENVGKLIAIVKADFPKRWRERLISLGYDRKL